MNWQPIDTAPEGCTVIAYWPAFDLVAFGRRRNTEHNRRKVLPWINQHGSPCIAPTHWMPLPEPPK